MEEKQKKVAGYVFFGIFAVTLVLVIIGMCIGGLSDTGKNGTGKLNYSLFSDELKAAAEVFKASNTLAVIGYVVAIVGVCALVGYVVLKLFLNKNIRILGILAALVSLAGGILIMVGGIVLAYKFNTLGGMSNTNILMWDPNAGIWLGGIAGIVAAIVGFVSSSKRFNQ